MYPRLQHLRREVDADHLDAAAGLYRKHPPLVPHGPLPHAKTFGNRVIGGVVTQFWTDVIWDVDYLFVDMPPGTGDVALSVLCDG